LTVYCATGNTGKLKEFQLAAKGTGIDVALLPGFRKIPECVEDGATFAENAAIKARHYGAYAADPIFTGLVFADDSGLVVDALDGAPGVRSARFAGPGANDERNNRLLLERLRGVRDRTARFVCVIALAQGTEVRGFFEGSVEGVILEEPRGAGGFGYDPLFYYPPFECTFGEAAEERKLAVSHRGHAFRKMLRSLGAVTSAVLPPVLSS
jgi:XTP/dITP diphosphohydrolase